MYICERNSLLINRSAGFDFRSGLLHLLMHKHPWKMKEFISPPPGYGLNNMTCVLGSLRKLLQQYLITKTELILQSKNMG